MVPTKLSKEISLRWEQREVVSLVGHNRHLEWDENIAERQRYMLSRMVATDQQSCHTMFEYDFFTKKIALLRLCSIYISSLFIWTQYFFVTRILFDDKILVLSDQHCPWRKFSTLESMSQGILLGFLRPCEMHCEYVTYYIFGWIIFSICFHTIYDRCWVRVES